MSDSSVLACAKNFNSSDDSLEARRNADRIAREIKNIQINNNGTHLTELNIALRSYYNLLHEHNLEDAHYSQTWIESMQHYDARGYLILQAILLIDLRRHINLSWLHEKSVKALAVAVEQNYDSLLPIVKVLNVLCKRCMEIDTFISLDQIYFCLQSSHYDAREETLILFTHCCLNPERAFGYFQVITTFWPWTNRNKYFLLSRILKIHAPSIFIEKAQICEDDFYAGLRLSLSYKSLLSASQHLVKSLSSQQSHKLLTLSVDIITQGTHKELHSFYTQWFSRIEQKDILLDLLLQNPKFTVHLLNDDNCDRYRLTLFLRMFLRPLLQQKIPVPDLLRSCFCLDTDCQLSIFKLFVANLSHQTNKELLDFMLNFIRQHKSIDDVQFRNSLLGAMPTVINHIAALFSKSPTAEANVFKQDVKEFFQQLHNIIQIDIGSDIYQPKIFSLRLLDILLRSLYIQRVEKNAKNCSISKNQQLGRFLIEEGIYDSAALCTRLLKLLNDPTGYDDALLLMTRLLKYLSTETTIVLNQEECLRLMQSCNVDECALSSLFAKVAVCTYSTSAVNGLCETVESCLTNAYHSFTIDPLFTCKTQSHLFGYLSTLTEIITGKPDLLAPKFQSFLDLINEICSTILDMLSLVNDNANAASFQDMDESLELFVQKSKIATENHEEARKFLLMSFWLTLKECCNLATAIGLVLVSTGEMTNLLEICLDINVTVLTRCRHKGAIEAAGSSLGRLVKSITLTLKPEDKSYRLLCTYLDRLFEEHQLVSRTRRGAGYSIMFLNIVKNEQNPSRPLLKYAMKQIFQHLEKRTSSDVTCKLDCSDTNKDRLEALILHYLCVLVKDSELRDLMSHYHDDIIMTAVVYIDDTEWTVCNAALQLFGALVPKIVGQEQSTDFESPLDFTPTEITFGELQRKLPKTCNFILEFFASDERDKTTSSTRSLILFLSFLAKVEHLRKHNDLVESVDEKILLRFRQLMWRLLSHKFEKVRKLAAVCLARAHEFRCDLPQALFGVANILFSITNENLIQGLVFFLIEGFQKLVNEAKYTLGLTDLDDFKKHLSEVLSKSFKAECCWKLHTLCKFLDLLSILGFNRNSTLISQLISLAMKFEKDTIGYDVWNQKVEQFS